MSQETTQAKSTSSLLNSILLFVLLGVVGFVGAATVRNGETLASIKASQLTRQEVDIRFTELKNKQDQLAADIVLIQIELAKLKSKP